MGISYNFKTSTLASLYFASYTLACLHVTNKQNKTKKKIIIIITVGNFGLAKLAGSSSTQFLKNNYLQKSKIGIFFISVLLPVAVTLERIIFYTIALILLNIDTKKRSPKGQLQPWPQNILTADFTFAIYHCKYISILYFEIYIDLKLLEYLDSSTADPVITNNI